MTPVLELLQAADFAAQRHAEQKRKGKRSEPYINHLLEVAGILAHAGVTDSTLLRAAMLHDCVEDVGVSPEELQAQFGPEVTALVLEVTDDKSLEKALRKQKQVDSAPHKSPAAKMLKIADKISNLRALQNSPPDWPLERQTEYFHWAKRVVDGCRGVNPQLDQLFDQTYQEGLAKLGS